MSMIEESPGNPAREEDLRLLIAELTRRIADLESDGSSESIPLALAFTDEKLATIALSIYRARRRRAKLFNKLLFSEPAWDMLLDLFIASVRGRVVSPQSLCSAADVPEAVGLRWIEVLFREGLIRRRDVDVDGQVTSIEISDRGFELMQKYVLDGVTAFEMPMPD